MKDDQQDPINEEKISRLARQFRYPSTPDVSARVRAKLEAARPGPRVGWKPAAVLVLALLLVLFSVPAVRAGIIEFFQVGVVRVFPAIATPAPLTATPPPGMDVPLPSSLLDLVGRTTLEDARQKAGFPFGLPTHPSDLGLPDIVYHQEELEMVILLWLEPGNPQKVRLSLQAINPDSASLKKLDVDMVRETTVNGKYALWATGSHMLEVQGRDYKHLRLVEGNVLIWETGGVTYRLETDLSMEEAIQIAESLRE